MSKLPVGRNNSNSSKNSNKSGAAAQSPSRRSRRNRPRQHPQTFQSSRTLADVNEFDSVGLEQALRELNCFEALGSPTNRRVIALEYLEGILEQWCLFVEKSRKAKQAASKPLSFAAAAAAGISSSSPQSSSSSSRSFPSAPVAASLPQNSTTATTSTRPKSFASAVSAGASTATAAGPAKPNAWNRKPAVVQEAHSGASPSAALIPFGSYRLGVHSKDSDLDLLALAPPLVSRADFFTSLVQLLEKDEKCQQVHPIPTAYTPVIKFVLNVGEEELHIDLVFARVQDATKLSQYQKQKELRKFIMESGQPAPAPAVYHLDDTDLQGLDEAGVRSLNGARVSQMLLASVPDIRKFQTVLRAVKQWAVVRGIYSNVLGFLGGVNWAIMVAYVCRQFPHASTLDTLRLFFRTFASWKWNAPIMLSEIQEIPPVTNASTQTRAVTLPAWNPRTNPRDRLHIMPIITPAYPSMNSSYNLGVSQLRRMQDEMRRTSLNLQKRRLKKNTNPYHNLFAPSDFFTCHKHFLQLKIRAGSQQDFVEWFRLVESKIRVLINSLETPQVHAVPFARFFDVPNDKKEHEDGGGGGDESLREKSLFIGLRFADGIDTVNLKPLALDFLHKVNSWERRNSSMDLFLTHVTDEDLPLYVWEAMKEDSRNRNNGGGSGTESHKDGTERSVASENTAPSTDDEDDDNMSCHSASNTIPTTTTNQGSLQDLASPTKKLCIMVTKQRLA